MKAALRSAVMRALGSGRDADMDIAGCFFVPGRIEVLGKHTDYAGGRSLLAAVERGFVIAAAARTDDVVRVIDSTSGEHVEFTATGQPRGRTPAWGTYPETVLRRCAQNFPAAAGGADIAFSSDLPQAAGLSSSSALVVATFLALDAVRGIARTPQYGSAIAGPADLAAYLGAVESGRSFRTLSADRGVGTMGGSEDHTAILCARAGRLVQYSFSPVRFEADVPVPEGWTFAIASSGVRAEKSGAAMAHYNRLSASVQRLVLLWQEAGAGGEATLGDIIAADAGASVRLQEIVRRHAPAEAEALLSRLAQFVAESEEIVPGACAALGSGDMAGFAGLVRRSMGLAVQALRNQTPETISLVETAHGHGAVAASAFGAGFGGSVWALVECERASEFLGSWRSAYIASFHQHAGSSEFFLTTAAASTARLTGGMS